MADYSYSIAISKADKKDGNDPTRFHLVLREETIVGSNPFLAFNGTKGYSVSKLELGGVVYITVSIYLKETTTSQPSIVQKNAIFTLPKDKVFDGAICKVVVYITGKNNMSVVSKNGHNDDLIYANMEEVDPAHN